MTLKRQWCVQRAHLSSLPKFLICECARNNLKYQASAGLRSPDASRCAGLDWEDLFGTGSWVIKGLVGTWEKKLAECPRTHVLVQSETLAKRGHLDLWDTSFLDHQIMFFRTSILQREAEAAANVKEKRPAGRDRLHITWNAPQKVLSFLSTKSFGKGDSVFLLLNFCLMWSGSPFLIVWS